MSSQDRENREIAKKEIALRDKEEIEPTQAEPTTAGIYYSPAVDIAENSEGIIVTADMPGVARENLDIDIKDNVLTLTGRVVEPENRLQLKYKEYGIGGYTRRFNLSEKIDQSKISANLKEGVLILQLPKAENLKPRKIAIGG